MLSFKKVMALQPYVYHQFVNSIGQTIKLAEHPTKGDEAEVLVICDELELVAYSGFFDCDDMLADHKEYEPKFIEGKLFIGDLSN